jgi:cytochrome c biogenesis protein CcdA/thiol-disulfide isomerase/thioredoxin
MLILIVFAFLAGIVTLASPCILPVLPLILANSVSSGRRRPLGVVTGFVLSFSFFTLFLSGLVQRFHLPADALRLFAILTIMSLGLVLWWPAAQLGWEKLTSKLAQLVPQAKTQTDGWWAGVLTGISLGLVWTPCVGPILAAVISLALVGTITSATMAIIVAYALGTALPMLAIMVGGRAGLQRVPWLLNHTQQIQRGFGVVMMIIGVAMALNLDRQFQTWLLQTFPQYGTGLTQIETVPVVQQALNTLRQPKALNPQGNYPSAPDFTGGNQWLNSESLSLAGNLKGKVVLVDFWTYSCINCIRTLPYLKQWYQTYKDQGFVIVGVHSPEFAFEKVTKNVQQAIKDFQITYPVVQDNDFAIWQAYQNQYWPAHYLIDAQGRIRYTTFGEGDYPETEAAIQALLVEAGQQPSTASVSLTQTSAPTGRLSPETYLGSARMALFDPAGTLGNGTQSFNLKNPTQDTFSLGGTWTVTDENLISGPEAILSYRFQAQHVYLVLGSGTEGQTSQIKVWLDGQALSTSGARVGAGADVGNGVVTVTDHRLYELINLPKNGSHVLKLEFLTPGTQAFAFTFG